MEERILAAIAALDKKIDKMDQRISALESGQAQTIKRISAIESGQDETHQMLRALMNATETNSAEINGLKLTTASVTALKDFRKDIRDVISYADQVFAKEG